MNSVVKWAGGIILGLLVMALIMAVATVIISNQRADKQYGVEGVPVAVPDDAASLAEGERLAAIRGCT